MKNLFVLVFLLTCSCFCYAQFELTPDGFISSDTKKNFAVKEFEGKSALDLYNEAFVAITSMYRSANFVVSKVEGELINIKALGDIEVKRVMNFNYTMDYNFIIRFKDGKIRFDAPILTSIYTYSGNHEKNYIKMQGSDVTGYTIFLFKKNGEVKHEKIKKDIEDYFNTLMNGIIEKISGNSPSDDW